MKMAREYEDGEEGAIWPKEMDVLEFTEKRETVLWEQFSAIWSEFRSGYSGSVLSAVASYCELFDISSIQERQHIYEFVKRCLPEIEDKPKDK